VLVFPLLRKPSHHGPGQRGGLRTHERADRRVKTAEQLRAQIAFCNTQLSTGYFPEEEEHIAAWLNQRYYHFKP